MEEVINEFDNEIEEDIVNKLDKRYENDLDKKLRATVKALNKVEQGEKLSNDELDIVNLFLIEEKVSILEFLERDYYDKEEIFQLLGKYAILELPYKHEIFCKEIINLIKLNKSEFELVTKKDFDKLLREIKKIEYKYKEKMNTAENKYVFVLTGVNTYIKFLNEKYSVASNFQIIERYIHHKGWKLENSLSNNVEDIKKEQRENRTENYVQMWKYRNMYNSKNKIELFLYRKMLLLDLKKMERNYRGISTRKKLTVATKETIINYYTYTLMMMYIANVENSREIVIAIWEKDIQLDTKKEKYIVQGAQRAKELLLKNKRYPTPREIVRKLNITKTRAEKYGLELLYLDTLSSGTRNRLLGVDKPQDLKKIVKDSKEERVEQGRKFFKLKQENGITNAEIAEQCGYSRKLVGSKLNEYIKKEYRIKSKKENFDEGEFIKEFGITKNKLGKIIETI